MADSRSSEEQLALRNAVDAAKQLLMERYGMAEGNAFEFLQEAVRREQLPWKDVAEQVINGIRRPQ